MGGQPAVGSEIICVASRSQKAKAPGRTSDSRRSQSDSNRRLKVTGLYFEPGSSRPNHPGNASPQFYRFPVDLEHGQPLFQKSPANIMTGKRTS